MTKDKKDQKAADEAATETVAQETTGKTLDATTPSEAVADDAAAPRDHTKEATTDVVKDQTTTEADKAAFDAALAGGNGDTEAPQHQLDVERIKLLIEKASQRGGVRLIDLVHQLETEEGMEKFIADDGDGDRAMIEMAGIRCRSTAENGRNLDNWCNAARRALLQVA